jgi:hypothetical protein
MGGSIGEIRGWSKTETYIEYEALSSEGPDGSWDPNPAAKKECKRRMRKDPNTGEWILPYRFHT